MQLTSKREGKGIEHMIADLAEPAESVEIRFNLTADNFSEVGDKILEDMRHGLSKLKACLSNFLTMKA